MDAIEILKTQNTPRIVFTQETGIFHMEGRSIPENPGEFYEPLMSWLESYFENRAPKTIFNINLDYVNSGSSKCLLTLLKIFKKQHQSGVNIEINWFYEEDDDAIKSLGEHYMSILSIPFNMKEYI